MAASDGTGQEHTGKSHANSPQDAKQRATANPAHDSNSSDQSPTVPTNQNQDAQPVSEQHTGTAAANLLNHTVVPFPSSHMENASPNPSAGQHPPAGREPAAQQQSGAAAGADIHVPGGISSARLIQRIGNSELRVGMHSSDFGSVSISTQAARNSISAQISLDHGDLAKAIAAHLPEIQARLGASQTVEVRISTSHNTVGQNGSPGGMSQSAGQGHAYRGRQEPRTQAAGLAVHNPAPIGVPVAAATREISSMRGRLDIRA